MDTYFVLNSRGQIVDEADTWGEAANIATALMKPRDGRIAELHTVEAMSRRPIADLIDLSDQPATVR